MTNEEVKEVLELIEDDIDCDGCRYFPDKEHCECRDECLYNTALSMAIKALEQEPCDDAVSRQAVLNEVREIATWHSGDAFNEDRVITHMKMLPSVTPKREQGEWIIEKDCEGKTRTCICPKCGEKTGKYTWKNPNYCSNCGAEMRTEREDKK